MVSIGARAAAVLWLAITASAIVWLVTHWFWQISVRPLSPPAVMLETHPEKLAQQVQATHLFGKTAGLVTAPTESSHMALIGIVSAASGPAGVAIISLDGKKPVTVTVGEEIAPGIVLSRVASDQVQLTQHGKAINLMLSAKK